MALVGSAAGAQPAAKDSDALSSLSACVGLRDAARRLACYDSTAGALLKARAAGDVQVVNRREMRDVRRNLFGFALPKLPFFTGDTSQNEADDRLETKIVNWRSLGYGKYRMVVDGGAVWETTEASEAIDPPAAGQPITIRKGALGSYVLRINNQRGVRGRRIS
ncbi:hypothetical protein GGQ97_000822 [Sphingomonas kaistensis]|uniref:Uncharacterized protein n=1 Tax=Sphingomonas kaistensis TaxID=298708 RepID=A0A7X5Y4I3_9SPHN|nr:hypothetical protein [Sphingomonas kaistensis]NJC05029.1 hypothetical protein [Sphingomonas kaistensis]